MIRPLIKSITDIVEYVDVKINDVEILPICHTSRWDKLINDINISESELRARKNDDYDEKLLFFFYGKAKYIPSEDVKNEYKKYPPFTLIYDLNDKIEEIHRLVVFDSGGYKRYKIEIDLKQFEIKNCSSDKLKKLITIFFKNNENYLNGQMTPNIDPEHFPLCGALHEYCRLGDDIKNKRHDLEYGEQAITFEIQFTNFHLHEKLLTAVIPDTYLSSDSSKEQFAALFGNKKVVPFPTDTQIHSYHNMSNTVKEEIDKLPK